MRRQDSISSISVDENDAHQLSARSSMPGHNLMDIGEHKTPLELALKRFDWQKEDWVAKARNVRLTTVESGGMRGILAVSNNAAEDFVVARIRIASTKNPLNIKARPLTAQGCLILSHSPPNKIADFTWHGYKVAGDAVNTHELIVQVEDIKFRVGIYYLVCPPCAVCASLAYDPLSELYLCLWKNLVPSQESGYHLCLVATC